MNKVISKYESAFAQLFGAKNAFSFWKARVALYAILKALGVGPGDEIILPGYSCVMNVNPIKYLGAKPVYVDIEPDTFNIKTEQIQEKITARTKILIAQHTYGYPCDMDSIMDTAERNGITVIEDCCLALGSKYKGKTVGNFGKAAYFSFQWNKPFTTGLGGMAVTNDSRFANKIREIAANELCQPGIKEVLMLAVQLVLYRIFIYPRTTALSQSLFRYLTKKGIVVGSSSNSEYEPVMSDDFFKSLSPIQALSGLRQLKKIKENIVHRKKMVGIYDKLLMEKGWKVVEFDKTILDPVMVRYPVRILEKQKALDAAASSGVELGSWFECPLHPIETPLAAYDYEIGMCPEAEKASNEVVNLPLHPRADDKTAKRTVEFITRFTQVI